MRRSGSTEDIMRVRPQQHGSWLFPVMVVAAASVVAFGALGLAVVTGHLRGKPATEPALVTAEAGTSKASAPGNVDGTAGLAGSMGQN